jgi:hypothetical protein
VRADSAASIPPTASPLPPRARNNALSECRETSRAGVCNSLSLEATTNCAALSGDAAALVEQYCPQGTNISEHDFTLAITSAFCFVSGSDAGGD